ncbi:LLM class flavin-dependent oxidoreductase [Paeniglutamicibacter sp. NPDC012692]|uniref:LLM class flavin-dependent oxidoreductase n=1 Tax=Paeniglutamicibacter sp. NPDC012692 TaxID=3364388 RepID=UPI0036AC47EF
MKKIGFLTFGHSGGSSSSPVPTGADAVRQMVDLAVAAEESGFDGAWLRVHHFGNSISTPFPLMAAMAAKTTTLEVGTGVIDMRYENPLYMAEQAGAVDAISSGRLQLGVSRGSPEPARDGQHQFGYDLEPGNSWANETRERTALFRKAISGAGIAHPVPGGHHHNGQDELLPINPISPGLENRIWWGAATIGSGLWTASVGMNLLSSTLLLEDDGRPFHVLQADQLRQYKEAYAASGHTTGGMTAVTRSAFPITTDKDDLYFGRRERGDSVGYLDGSVARSGPTYSGSPEEVAQQFMDDEAISEADYVLFALPNQLGVDYNAHVMTEIANIAREIGWKAG